MTSEPTSILTRKKLNLTQRIAKIRDLLLTDLIERDVEVRMVLLAALAGEHALLIGPPGTAKSMIAKRIQLAFNDASYFERLLTRFTVPEEVFGPYSIPGLEEGRYERLTESYMPSASVAFLDEIFKANSAILNSLLTVLNERKFDNGTQRQFVPLISAIGASNELPEGQELDALYDRFLVRLEVNSASAEGFRKLLALTGETALVLDAELPFSPQELEELRKAAETVVTLSAEVEELLCELRKFCIAEEIFVSDRRWRKIVKFLKVSAYTHIKDEVTVWDCWILQHCLWNTPEQRATLFNWYVERIGAAEAGAYSRVSTVVAHLEEQLKFDQKAKEQKCNEDGELLYRMNGREVLESSAVLPVVRDGETTYLAPPNAYANDSKVHDRTNKGHGFTIGELSHLQIDNWHRFDHWGGKWAYLANEDNFYRKDTDLRPVMVAKRFAPQYRDARLKDASVELDRVTKHQALIEDRVKELEVLVNAHLWVTADFLKPALKSLDEALSATKVITARLDKVREGYANLPVQVWGDPEEELVDLIASPPKSANGKKTRTKRKKGAK
ncbi:AAA family ATPase [Microvenator marinus]|uniref:AAA family ATPase n=1 Tax=Microvenator marinus TaxID=2600177 RepID=A0A5B8XYC0_9DELT|nr:AAA family ATPase [Microvenator marinus]QED29958.1 AAA family ATPase [Microvenator marinus]